jgi:hypothetical protein
MNNIEYKKQIIMHSLNLLQKIADDVDSPVVSRFSDCGHTPSGSFDFGNTCARGSDGESDDDEVDNEIHGVDEDDEFAGKESEDGSDEESKWLEDTIKNFEKLPNKKKAKESLKQAMTLLQDIVSSFMDDEPEDNPKPKSKSEVAASPQGSVQKKETGETKSKSEHKSESKSDNNLNSIAEDATKHMDRQKAMAEIDKLADTNPKELVNMANEFLGSKVAKSKKDAINKIKDAVSIQIRDAMRARDIKNQ